MTKKKYSLINIFNSTRLDIEVKDLVEACSYAMVLFFDREKKWEAKEETAANGMEFVDMRGFHKENGKKIYIVVAETKDVDNSEVFSHLEKVN